jgi:hypothetical protein
VQRSVPDGGPRLYCEAAADEQGDFYGNLKHWITGRSSNKADRPCRSRRRVVLCSFVRSPCTYAHHSTKKRPPPSFSPAVRKMVRQRVATYICMKRHSLHSVLPLFTLSIPHCDRATKCLSSHQQYLSHQSAQPH